MMTQPYAELMAHMEWADSEVWRVAFALPAALSDTNLRERLWHIHVVQQAFFQLWQDRPLTIPGVDKFSDLASLRAWALPYYGEVFRYLERIDPQRMEQNIVLPWGQQLKERFGEVNAVTLRETLLQVIWHTTHHRGQVNTRLKELGGEPPLLDFLAWVWRGRPTPQWQEQPV